MKVVFRFSKFIFMIFVAAVLIFFTAAPVINLFIGAVGSALAGKTTIAVSENFGLLFKSIIIYSGASILCVIIGFFVAVNIWTMFEKRAVKFAVFLLLLILVPPFVHVQSWIYFMDKINAFLAQTLGFTQNFSGEFAVILTMAFSDLPITAGLCLMAFLSVPSEINDQCRLDESGRKSFLNVYLPLVAPALIVSGLLVFLLNINDYGIPSVFGVNVFSLELYSLFSANGDMYSVFFASLPLLLLCLALLVTLGIYMKQIHFSFSGFKGGNPFKKSLFVKVISQIGLVIFAFFALVPTVNLIYEAMVVKDLIKVISGSMNEFSFSIWTSLLSAILCLFPAVIFAYFYSISKHKVLLLCLAALPFVIPSAISGISMIQLWNTPILHDIYQSPFMPTVAMIGRFSFIEALVISFAMLRIEKALIDNLRLHYAGVFKTFLCLVALLWKECLAGILIVFALAMSEFGVTLLVTPPGSQTITNKIYNYLHYGASDIVAVLCLGMLLSSLLLAVMVFLLLKGGKIREEI